MMERKPGIAATSALLAGLICSAAAAAQTTPTAPMTPAGATPPANPRYLLTAPLYDSSSASPYDLGAPPVASGPPAAAATPPAPDYSFAEFAKNIHGYVSAGVATHGGHAFSGGVVMPLSPNVELSVAGMSSQVGGFRSLQPGGKNAIAHFDAYQVGLHVQPADNIDAYIGFEGAQIRAPFWPYMPR